MAAERDTYSLFSFVRRMVPWSVRLYGQTFLLRPWEHPKVQAVVRERYPK